MTPSVIGRIVTAAVAGLVLALPAGALGDGTIKITQDRTDPATCAVEFTAKKRSDPYVWGGSYFLYVQAYENANFSGTDAFTNTSYVAIANRQGVLAGTFSGLATSWSSSKINSAQIHVNYAASFAWSATGTSKNNSLRYSNRCS